MRARGINPARQEVQRPPPPVLDLPPAVGAISEYKPNFSERLGQQVGDGLARLLGWTPREGARTGRRFTDFLHDVTPVGNADGISYPTSELDRQLSMMPLPGPTRRGGRAIVGEVEDALGGGARRTVEPRPRAEPPKGGKSTPSYPEHSYANHSWESVPGETTDHLPIPDELKGDYHSEAKKIFLTGDGRSRIAQGYGFSTKPSFDNVGYYKGTVSPGTQDRVGVRIDPATGKLDPHSAAEMNLLGRTHATPGAQDAFAWNHFTPTNRLEGANAIRFDLGRSMSEEDIRRYDPIIKSVYGDSVGILPDEQGFRIAQYEELHGLPPIGEFVERLHRRDPRLRDANMVPGINSTGYGENDWRGSGRFAAGYGWAKEENPLPDIGKRFDLFAPQIADKVLSLDPRKAAQYGLGTSEDIELLRRTIAEKGWDGFMQLIKSGRISNAIAPLVLGWAGLGQVEEDR